MNGKKETSKRIKTIFSNINSTTGELDPFKPDEQGWIHAGPVMEEGEDSRHFVSLEQAGMAWVGIRSYHLANGRWYNGSDPEVATVVAWQKMIAPTRHYWEHGKLL